MEGDLHDLLAQKEELDVRINNLQAEYERSNAQLKADAENTFYELLCKLIFLYSRTRNSIIIQ